jgi:hypothetical protein
MKGFEVRFRDKTVKIAVNESMSMTIIIQKLRGKMDLHVGAWLIDTDKHVAWIGAEELHVGDEIVIERKEIDESSLPLVPPPGFDPSYRSPEDIADMWEIQKQRFRELENKLKEEGLI